MSAMYPTAFAFFLRTLDGELFTEELYRTYSNSTNAHYVLHGLGSGGRIQVWHSKRYKDGHVRIYSADNKQVQVLFQVWLKSVGVGTLTYLNTGHIDGTFVVNGKSTEEAGGGGGHSEYETASEGYEESNAEA